MSTAVGLTDGGGERGPGRRSMATAKAYNMAIFRRERRPRKECVPVPRYIGEKDDRSSSLVQVEADGQLNRWSKVVNFRVLGWRNAGEKLMIGAVALMLVVGDWRYILGLVTDALRPGSESGYCRVRIGHERL